MPKAYVYTAHGDARVEAFHDIPAPVPGPGELPVRVRAAGVNPVDWKRRTGYLPAGAAAPALPAEALAEWVVQGKLRPHVTDVFALRQAGEALRHVENGHARGKTVIAVAG